jgi:hypothetical protein
MLGVGACFGGELRKLRFLISCEVDENRGSALNESSLIDNDAGVVEAENLMLCNVGPELASLCFDFH